MGRPSKKPQLLEDRISKLSDDILHQILSHLTTKCTVKTSILSKRWRYLWTSTRALRFYCREFSSTSIAKFICFVDRVLSLRDNSDIENFTLRWRSNFDIYKAKEWLSYALRYNVKEVDLYIQPGKECSDSLPSDLLRCQSLHVLKLTAFYAFTILKFPSIISANLSKLKTLYIHTGGPCEAITELISKCPVLENLSMSMVSCDLEISAPYLKELAFCCHHGTPKLRIFAPKLVRLDVRCIFRIPELLFECKLENLADASISSNGGSGKNLLEILRCLQNAKSLTLRGNVVELLHQVSKKPLPSLCNLEKLVVEFPKKILRRDWISWESCYTCSLNNLKEVEILGCHFGDEEEACLVNFVLHQSSSLRRVKIGYYDKFPDYETSTKMINKLKSLALSLGATIKFTPCTTTSLDIIFDGPFFRIRKLDKTCL